MENEIRKQTGNAILVGTSFNKLNKIKKALKGGSKVK